MVPVLNRLHEQAPTGLAVVALAPARGQGGPASWPPNGAPEIRFDLGRLNAKQHGQFLDSLAKCSKAETPEPVVSLLVLANGRVAGMIEGAVDWEVINVYLLHLARK
jgi:hypothetical protein